MYLRNQNLKDKSFPDSYKLRSECERIPEFPTVALPIVGVIGLMFLFQRRKGGTE